MNKSLEKVILALEGLEKGGLLNYIGVKLIEFLEKNPESDTGYKIARFYYNYTLVEVQKSILTSSLNGSDWEEAIEEWIFKDDRKEFIENYVPDFINRYLCGYGTIPGYIDGIVNHLKKDSNIINISSLNNMGVPLCRLVEELKNKGYKVYEPSDTYIKNEKVKKVPDDCIVVYINANLKNLKDTFNYFEQKCKSLKTLKLQQLLLLYSKVVIFINKSMSIWSDIAYKTQTLQIKIEHEITSRCN